MAPSTPRVGLLDGGQRAAFARGELDPGGRRAGARGGAIGRAPAEVVQAPAAHQIDARAQPGLEQRRRLGRAGADAGRQPVGRVRRDPERLLVEHRAVDPQARAGQRRLAAEREREGVLERELLGVRRRGAGADDGERQDDGGDGAVHASYLRAVMGSSRAARSAG
jgi:hypothetical protein